MFVNDRERKGWMVGRNRKDRIFVQMSFLEENSIGRLVEIKLDTNSQYFPSASSLVYFCISLINLSSPRALSMASDLKVERLIPRKLNAIPHLMIPLMKWVWNWAQSSEMEILGYEYVEGWQGLCNLGIVLVTRSFDIPACYRMYCQVQNYLSKHLRKILKSLRINL